jgi:hypothetical protein
VITLEAVIAAEANLIQLYKTAISGVSRATASLLSQHEQHLRQLSARLVLPSATPPPPGRQSPSPGTPTAAPARVTAAHLRAAEQGSAADLVRRLGAAEPALAQLFASIAACHATHVAALAG